MAKTVARLTARGVDALTKPGLHSDGGGLYLQVSPTGARPWIYRYTVAGKVRTMGLGAYPVIGLAVARQKAAEAGRQRAEGEDPLALKREADKRRKVVVAREKTFAEVAREYVDRHRAAWKGDKTQVGWERSLFTYAAPLASLPISEVDKARILAVLQPRWVSNPESARRLRRHLESVLAFAIAHGYRTGENPALWRGNLQFALPALGKIEQVRHHPALPFEQVPAFMTELRQQTALSALAFEFCILTACRTSEVLQATWSEVDLEKRIWAIPAGRMKASRGHRVPLSDRALEILGRAKAFRREAESDGEDYIFPGERRRRPLSNMAFLMLLRRMGRSDLTGHGFRSSFRDWAAETTDFPNHVVEMALAHVVGNAVEAAYRRGDLFEKRRELMDAWATHCGTQAGYCEGPMSSTR